MIPAFQAYQQQFAQHIRNPKVVARPAGVKAARMAVYDDIVFNNLRSMVESCFPVTKEVLGVRRWRRLFRDFFIQHRCTTPIFRQIPEEFLRWLEAHPQSDAPPFLANLVHYEWIELSLALAEAPASTSIDPQGDLLAGRPILAPIRALLSYPYAVHRISKRYKPTQLDEQVTHLMVFRRGDDEVKFVILNEVSAALVSLLASGEMTGEQALNQICTELRHPNPQVVIMGGLQIMQNLYQEQAIIGTKKGDKNAA